MSLLNSARIPLSFSCIVKLNVHSWRATPRWPCFVPPHLHSRQNEYFFTPDCAILVFPICSPSPLLLDGSLSPCHVLFTTSYRIGRLLVSTFRFFHRFSAFGYSLPDLFVLSNQQRPQLLPIIHCTHARPGLQDVYLLADLVPVYFQFVGLFPLQ